MLYYITLYYIILYYIILCAAGLPGVRRRGRAAAGAARAAPGANKHSMT